MSKVRTATFRLLYSDVNDGFADLFDAELDSAFTADIACCDNCHEDFIKTWPSVYLWDPDYDNSAISLKYFFENTALSDIFTEEQFWNNLKKISCPRCNGKFTENIWTRGFLFDVPDWFEKESREISQIAEKTPFLVLTHPFAQRVFKEIQDAMAAYAGSLSSKTYYRARPISQVSEPSPSQLGPPPEEFVQEGRYNHAGQSVLYLASDAHTAFLESSAPKDGVFIAEISLQSYLKVLDLTDDRLKSDVLQALVASSLLSAPGGHQGWKRPEYVFSRFVSDCAFFTGWDGILYPSVKSYKGHNLVLFNRVDWGNIMTIGNIIEFRA